MFLSSLLKATLLALSVSSTIASRPIAPTPGDGTPSAKGQAVRQPAPKRPTVQTNVNGAAIAVNTSTTVHGNTLVAAAPVSGVVGTSVASTVLILARDSASAYSAYSGLNGYGIPYQVVTVPQTGTTLPILNSTATAGNYGTIVLLSEVSYDYGGTIGFTTALSAAQLTTLYQYQVNFGVRMVRLDVFPTADFGTVALGGCCNAGIEQLIYITDSSTFPTAGLNTGVAAGVSTNGIWHYPAAITNASIATEFAQFAAGSGFATSTAGVINNIAGRQQMVFFTSFATDWSASSNFLQHAWIHWATRGLYSGYRRVNLNTQIDDSFLETDIYSPANTTFQWTPADLTAHVSWQQSVNSRLSPGSSWFMEVGHNGNGNIENSADIATGSQCGRGPIEYPDQVDCPLEWAKPLGTGTNLWPATPSRYPFTTTCTNLDSLLNWWQNTTNLNSFAHISHTFTHEDENNITSFDAGREIVWNQNWLYQVGISHALKWSPKGIIPPAITGLHNGDAIQAWMANGISEVVGDNTRPVLMNTVNEHWPLISTVAGNGYAGLQINPRWATNIYYNCNSPACTVLEWINTSSGKGDFYTLLGIEKNTNTRHLLGLHHDPYMFHQANLNYQTADQVTINGVTQKLSLFQSWVETVTQEMTRLVTWPLISLKQDDMSAAFLSRMNRDACGAQITWTTTPTTITGFNLTTANGNTCSEKIPITLPGTVKTVNGGSREQIGSDPLTIWVTINGTALAFVFDKPITL